MAKLIMIVDDDRNLRFLYRDEFIQAGYDVVLADSGEEALDLADRTHPDLMVIDIMLNGMDGLEAMHRALEKQPGLPVIINTGYRCFMDDFRCWPARAYVLKSADMGELKTRIEECLKEAHSR